MSKDTPQARFFRTLLTLLAAVAASAATYDWVSNLKGSGVLVALGVIASVVGAAVAALQVVMDWKATTPLGKAAVSFAQIVGPGLATLAITDWTGAAFVNFGQSALRFVVAGVFAAVGAYALNRAEDGPKVEEPA